MAPDTAALTKRPIARDADLDRMRERAGALRGRIGANGRSPDGRPDGERRRVRRVGDSRVLSAPRSRKDMHDV